MTNAQRDSLWDLCGRYHVPFREDDYHPQFDLPPGYVAGWVGGNQHGGQLGKVDKLTIYVGVDPEGAISS